MEVTNFLSKTTFLHEIDASTDMKSNHLIEQKTGTKSKLYRTHIENFLLTEIFCLSSILSMFIVLIFLSSLLYRETC